MREPGFYWVKFLPGDNWEPARYVRDNHWEALKECMGVEQDDIAVVGPRILPPEEPPA